MQGVLQEFVTKSSSLRVLPHFQDTGGFFIAVLEKKDWLPWQSKMKAKSSSNSTVPPPPPPPKETTPPTSQEAHGGEPAIDEERKGTFVSDSASDEAALSAAAGSDKAAAALTQNLSSTGSDAAMETDTVSIDTKPVATEPERPPPSILGR